MKSKYLSRVSLPALSLAVLLTAIQLTSAFASEERRVPSPAAPSPTQTSPRATAPTGGATAGPEIRNFEDFARDLNLSAYYRRRIGGADRLRIAVLDNGFGGYEAELGRTLPASTSFHPGPLAPNGPTDRHGLVMAQLLYGLLTDRGRASQFEPELHLYNTFGYDNFKAAIDDVIARRVDIVLYAQVWEYGGNGDGRGFIDALVRRALGAGVLWVNAAGDFGVTTYSGPVRTVEDDWVELPDPNHGLQIRCLPNARDACGLRLVLSWNDFKDDVTLGTNKDLDLVLVDDTLNVVQASTLAQVQKTTDGVMGQSLYPREILTTTLKPGLYSVRIKDRSHNFGARDRFRVTATGESILMPRHVEGESLLNPADLPGVITVGASDTEMSSESRSLRKPELKTPSLVRLDDGQTPAGSSSAAAAAVAGLAMLKTVHPDWDRAALLRGFVTELQRPAQNGGGAPGPTSGISLPMLDFGPTGPGCFVPVDASTLNLPYYAYALLRSGGTLAATTAGPRLFVGGDPLGYSQNLRRTYPNDAVVLGPEGLQVLPRSVMAALGAGYYEVVQLPRGQRLCSATDQASAAAGSWGPTRGQAPGYAQQPQGYAQQPQGYAQQPRGYPQPQPSRRPTATMRPPEHRRARPIDSEDETGQELDFETSRGGARNDSMLPDHF